MASGSLMRALHRLLVRVHAISVALNEECHSQRLRNKQIGLLKISELSTESEFLLLTRTALELQIVEKEQICLHHEKNTYQDPESKKGWTLDMHGNDTKS